MKSVLARLGLIACIALFSNAANAACARTAFKGSDRAISISGKVDHNLLNKVILDEVNYTRCKSGLPALTSKSALRKAAEKHSKWMAKSGTLSHQSSVKGQSTVQTRIKSAGLEVNTGAENIIRMTRYQITGGPFFVKNAATCEFTDPKGNILPPHSYTSLAREAVRQWVASPVHRKNFMHNRMIYTASAAAVDPKGPHCGSVYLTQLFVG